MKNSSTEIRTAKCFAPAAAMLAVLGLSGIGCGEGHLEFEKPSGTATSLTTDEPDLQSTTIAADDRSDVSVAGPNSDPDGSNQDDSTGQPASSAAAPDSSDESEADSFDPEPEPDSSSASATNNATEVATADDPDAVAAAPVKPQGTKLPKDLLKGSQLTPLNPRSTVLLDLQGKRILLRARVCLTEGLLEMLLCPHQTKEHESILSTDALAYTVHTGLLAIGCKEGQAARYNPDTEKYIPASGQIIDIFLHWVDVDGKLHREPAQNWVRRSRQHYYQAKFESLPADLKLEPDGNLRYDDVNQYLFWYGPMDEQERDACLKLSADKKFQAAIRKFHKDGLEKPMVADWVFVGSGFYEDGDSAKQYLAEGGYMICVANFAMAMIDVATPSDSNGTESLAYEAATERIPPRGSEVLIELVPRPAKKPATEKTAPAVDKSTLDDDALEPDSKQDP
jgi:hypothetical protein